MLHQLALNVLYTCQSDICFLPSKVTNQSQLISNCFTCYVYTITSTKVYDNYILKRLINLINKYIYSLQKVSLPYFLDLNQYWPLLEISRVATVWSSHPSHILSHSLSESNIIFSQDISHLVMMYHQTYFGCKSPNVSVFLKI